MAKRNTTSLEMTPLMGLSMLALFIMMPTIFILSNNQREATKTLAAQATPTPTPTSIDEFELPLPSEVSF